MLFISDIYHTQNFSPGIPDTRRYIRGGKVFSLVRVDTAPRRSKAVAAASGYRKTLLSHSRGSEPYIPYPFLFQEFANTMLCFV
jgi:hypothetical protein